MKRGRKPTPPELRKGKRIEGTAKAVEGRPECPDHLDAIARAKWDDLVGLLEELGVLSRTDGDLIALYCEAYGGYRHCLDRLKDPESMVITSPKGFKLNSPWVNLRNSFARDMARLLAEMGLTPSARSRVATTKAEESRLAKFLRESR